MDRVDLSEIKSLGSVDLDRVKRADNQAFHLQLVYVVQLVCKSYRGKKEKCGEGE